MLRLVLGVFCASASAGCWSDWCGANRPERAPSVARIVIGALTFQGAVPVLTWRFLRGTWGKLGNRIWVSSATEICSGIWCASFILFLPTGIAIQSAGQTYYSLWRNRIKHATGCSCGERIKIRPGIIAMAVVTVPLAPLAEEFLFRGVLYPAVKQSGYPRALPCGGYSRFIRGDSLKLDCIFFPFVGDGVVLTAVLELTGNLMASIAMHICCSMALIFLGRFLLKTVGRSGFLARL